ncbi:hypothetical protein L210DRAFT_949356 [Boletus edulis BED1]|uniref:Uncharacterized protein n=1 Tax=Boletus edulis BED1 TaxID=1328754 RepID=A0AAD4BMH7_BOLED|nr:hypothetical protein L210DRAFT_949356 [Boletus edulis BED1]
MDDERFPSQVAPNERLSLINEEDGRIWRVQRSFQDTNEHPAQSRCLLILQGTRQRTFGTVLSWRELRNTVCQDQIDHDTQASDQMDDERFPSQVAPNERLSQINEEDKRAMGGFGGSLRAQRKRETWVFLQPEYAKEGSCSSPRDSCQE